MKKVKENTRAVVDNDTLRNEAVNGEIKTFNNNGKPARQPDTGNQGKKEAATDGLAKRNDFKYFYSGRKLL